MKVFSIEVHAWVFQGRNGQLVFKASIIRKLSSIKLSVGMLVDEMRFAVGYVSPVCLLFYSNFMRISLL